MKAEAPIPRKSLTASRPVVVVVVAVMEGGVMGHGQRWLQIVLGKVYIEAVTCDGCGGGVYLKSLE